MSSIYKSILILIFLSFNFALAFKAPFPETKQELRAVWVTPLEDPDLSSFKNKEEFQKHMTYLMDVLKFYNLNSIVFHIRTHNDAMYNSKLNPLSKYWAAANFSEFDPLKWLIGEMHKRGIEFHAWLNPYRVKSKSGVTKAEVAQEYTEKGFTVNPASDTKYLLLGLSGDTPNIAYLNPGLVEVRNFIRDTILEIMTNYDVDAIHFDDYFYYNMGANGKTSGEKTILDEEDQKTYLAYIEKYGKYDPKSATDKADWRREQVSDLIELLHNSIREFNKENKRYVRLGISPSGVWKSGNGIVTYDEEGNAISTGSKTTTTFEHYGSYLFADTLHWINKEWVDYMMPQSYWASDHPQCPYVLLMDWWNKVVKYKKVDMFSGHGLYMSDRNNTYGWCKSEEEFSIQLKTLLSSSDVGGSCVYHFSALRKFHDGESTMSAKQVKRAFIDNKYWNERTPPNEIKSFEKIILGPVIFTVEDKTISFNKMEGAKFYAIYRLQNEKYILIDVIGGGDEEIIKYKDDIEGEYEYTVRAISYSNTLGVAS